MTSVYSLMSMEGRTVLITGATGFLGSYMAETIAELGGDLILVDIETANYITLKFYVWIVILKVKNNDQF